MKKLITILFIFNFLISFGQNEINYLKDYQILNSGGSVEQYLAGVKIIKDKINPGYFILGTYRVYPSTNNNVLSYAARINPDGSKDWFKVLNKGYYTDINQLSNGNLLFASGRSYYNLAGTLGFLLSVTGSVNWQYNYLEYGECNAAIESFNNLNQPDGVVGCGKSSNNNIVCVKANSSNGIIIWSNTYNFGGTVEVASDICSTPDGGYIITGRSDDYLLIFKIDNNGNMVWSEKLEISPGIASLGTQVICVPDGNSYSAIIAGKCGSNSFMLNEMPIAYNPHHVC